MKEGLQVCPNDVLQRTYSIPGEKKDLGGTVSVERPFWSRFVIKCVIAMTLKWLKIFIYVVFSFKSPWNQVLPKCVQRRNLSPKNAMFSWSWTVWTIPKCKLFGWLIPNIYVIKCNKLQSKMVYHCWVWLRSCESILTWRRKLPVFARLKFHAILGYPVTWLIAIYCSVK